MIEAITKKIMIGGLDKYASELNNDNVQIRISLNNEIVKYEISISWQPTKEISFRDILNKKLDILGYEQLASPVMEKSIKYYSELFEENEDKISVFLFKHKDSIALAVYNDLQNVKVTSLSKHFQKIGM
jgi:hypothetical protein